MKDYSLFNDYGNENEDDLIQKINSFDEALIGQQKQ